MLKTMLASAKTVFAISLLVLATVTSQSVLAASGLGTPGLPASSPQQTLRTNSSAAPTSTELEMVYSKSVMALNFLSTFWQGKFAAHRKRFDAPRTFVTNQGAAFYQSRDHAIYFNPAFFVDQMRRAAQQTRTDGDMAFIVILAHEYGHAVQRQLGQSTADCFEVEAQADRLAGAFVRAARDAGRLDPGDLDEATFTFFSGRDETGRPNDCPHGSGTVRVRNFFAGFEAGADGVGLRW